jgi:glycosyltransferase involved in cell wall biosynthesis
MNGMTASSVSPGASRLKVLFLMIQMGMGGSERLILNLIRHMDRTVFEPSVAWMINERPLKEFEDEGIPLYYVPKTRRIDPAAMRRLAGIVRANRVDIVNAHHFLAFVYAYYGARIANRTGLVYTEHSEEDVVRASLAWRAIGGLMLRRSDAAIGVSELVSKRLLQHFRLKPSQVQTIENGVDVQQFSAGSGNRAELRRRFGFAANDVVVGLVANFRRNKNHIFLVQAFHAIANELPNASLVLVGQGFAGDSENSEPEVRAYVRDHGLEGRIRLLGYRPDVHDLLRAMDVFSLVSFKEGLPLSLIEGMATGLPAVGTSIDGIKGVIEPEVNGLLVRPGDVAGLAAALRRLITDESLRQRMGDASRRLARTKYSLTRCVDETQQIFLKAASNSSVQAAS